jgi:DNA replication protein DnaC
VNETTIRVDEGAVARLRIASGKGDFAVAEVTEASDCDACDGSGRRVVQREDGTVFVQPCACRIPRDACRRFNAARIPKRLATKTLDNFRVDGDQAAAAMARHRVQQFVEAYGTPEGRHGFILMGSVGIGKSHLLAAALRVLTLERGAECRYVEFFHLLSELKDGYSSGKSDMEIIAPLCDVEVLAVDELGKGRGSDWEMYVLDEIISRRYNADKVTLFATNYTDNPRTTLKGRLPQAGGGFARTRGPRFTEEAVAETLVERVGERIYSRLREMCDPIAWEGPDFRRSGALGER